jgi:hypothetical protein
MAPQSQRCAQIYTQVVIITCGLLVTCPIQAIEGRPPLSAACQAWNSHIAGLIDQHRLAHELDDDQLGDIIRRFYEAQHACSVLRFEEGLTLYESIPIGAVASRLLR